MTAFILSAGLAFAIYELLALLHVPNTGGSALPGSTQPPSPFPFPGGRLEFEPSALRRVKIFGRVLIVLDLQELLL